MMLLVSVPNIVMMVHGKLPLSWPRIVPLWSHLLQFMSILFFDPASVVLLCLLGVLLVLVLLVVVVVVVLYS